MGCSFAGSVATQRGRLWRIHIETLLAGTLTLPLNIRQGQGA